MIAIVGGGAAGIATAIFAARRGVKDPLVVFEGARRPGAKILVSGGSRCNVTNAVVQESDFEGSPRHLVRRVLRSFGVSETIAFFAEIGVGLHQEERGKLFPDANRSRAVLDALLRESSRLGVALRASERVTAVEAQDDGFRVRTETEDVPATAVVLATGGLSLPKSGSDGHGLRIAASLGHAVVPTTPALVPLALAGRFHAGLAGVAQDAELSVRVGGRLTARRRGSLLWTHFGVSGPVVLDISRAWLRAQMDGASPTLLANLRPGFGVSETDGELIELARSNPRLSIARALAAWLPATVARAIAVECGIEGARPVGQLRRDERRALVGAIVERPLPVVGSRGYDFAEATAGGVPLGEIDTRTMESRRQAGLYFAGEIVDVDGRVGGFNFQWAWSSAWVAAGGLAGGLKSHDRIGASD